MNEIKKIENILKKIPIYKFDYIEGLLKKIKIRKKNIKLLKKKFERIEEKIQNLQNDFKKKFCSFATNNYKHVLIR
jgi:acyl carrier protein phosphodiesterase